MWDLDFGYVRDAVQGFGISYVRGRRAGFQHWVMPIEGSWEIKAGKGLPLSDLVGRCWDYIPPEP